MKKTYQITDRDKIEIDFADYLNDIAKTVRNYYEKGMDNNPLLDEYNRGGFWELAVNIADSEAAKKGMDTNSLEIENLYDEIYYDLQKTNDLFKITYPVTAVKELNLNTVLINDKRFFIDKENKIFGKKTYNINGKAFRVFIPFLDRQKLDEETKEEIYDTVAQDDVLPDKEALNTTWNFIINKITLNDLAKITDLDKTKNCIVTVKDLKWFLKERPDGNYVYTAVPKQGVKIDSENIQKFDLPYQLWKQAKYFFKQDKNGKLYINKENYNEVNAIFQKFNGDGNKGIKNVLSVSLSVAEKNKKKKKNALSAVKFL